MVIVPFWSLNWVQGSSSFVREIWENPITVFFLPMRGGSPPLRTTICQKTPKMAVFTHKIAFVDPNTTCGLTDFEVTPLPPPLIWKKTVVCVFTVFPKKAVKFGECLEDIMADCGSGYGSDTVDFRNFHTGVAVYDGSGI